MSETDMRSLHDLAIGQGIQLVADEVYHPIYHGWDAASAASLPHATVVGDFSKAFALSGLRLGWVIERDDRRREAYQRMREYFTISNSPVTEHLAEIAVHNREAIFRHTREVARANLALLDQTIKEHPTVLEWVRPLGGMVGFPRLVSGDDARVFCEAALGRGLLLVPGDCFGSPDRVRIGFGVGRDWYSRAMERFADFLTSWRSLRPDDTRQAKPFSMAEADAY